MKSFNINDTVKVKLTEAGRNILRDRHDEAYSSVPQFIEKPEYKLPEVDSNGYTKFQLHELMNIFGGSLYNWALPFETTILFRNEDLK